MSRRDPESIAFELEYVRGLLDDAMALNTAAPAIADKALPIMVAALELIGYFARRGGERRELELLETILGAVDSLLHEVEGAQQKVRGMIELLGGRVDAIDTELRGDDG